jgi:hypothetical protein
MNTGPGDFAQGANGKALNTKEVTSCLGTLSLSTQLPRHSVIKAICTIAHLHNLESLSLLKQNVLVVMLVYLTIYSSSG